jgi:hypothetical protein
MKLMSLAAIAALGVAVSGCASIVEGTTQSIAVTSSPQDDAKCVLTNSEGIWYVTTPGNAQVHKTKNNLDVVCTKAGFRDGRRTIESSFNSVTVGNLVAGGIVGIGIDAATGANFNYPTEINIPMDPENSGPVAPQASAATPSVVTAPAGIR